MLPQFPCLPDVFALCPLFAAAEQNNDGLTAPGEIDSVSRPGLQALAKKTGLVISEHVRRAIDAYLSIVNQPRNKSR
jgi:hypothetical protein